MRRWHAERDLMLRRWKNEIADHGGHAGYHVGEVTSFGFLGNSWLEVPIPPVVCEDSCHCFAGPGFFRKRKPFDCGKSRCLICHSDKFWEAKNRHNGKRKAVEFELRAYK